MKWLLITTKSRDSTSLGSNVGDEFARLGIERLIRDVDPDSEFDRLDKENASDWDGEHPHDRVVICGMPMFWSNEEQQCQDIYWWEYIWNSYVGKEKRKILPMGIGHVLIGHPHDGKRYAEAIREVSQKSWHVVVREPIYGAPESWIQSVCPSAFCNLRRQHRQEIRCCNIMPGGGHFGHLTDAGKRWDEEQAPAISEVLLSCGFRVIAHTKKEVEHAQALGWPRDRIACYHSAQEYLDLYLLSSLYFGNRLHGAAVCAAGGTPTWGVTHDSRLGMVDRLGGKATTTKDVTAEAVQKWVEAAKPPLPTPEFIPGVQYMKMFRMMERFAHGE